MANQNGFQQPQMPINYSYPVQNQSQQFIPQFPQMQGITHIAEVPGGYESVVNYPITPGTTALLIQFFDQNTGKFWLKSKDTSCRPIPPIEFDFSITQPTQQVQNQTYTQQNSQQVYNKPIEQPIKSVDNNNFVSKSDFEELKKMVSDLHSALNG